MRPGVIELKKLEGNMVKLRLEDCCIVGDITGRLTEVGEGSERDATIAVETDFGTDAKISFYSHTVVKIEVVGG